MTDTTVCALHGFSKGPESFSALSIANLWTPWLLGHGPSPDISSASFDAELCRLETLIKERQQERTLRLLGYSMGARVALALALRCPRLFSDVTLIGVNPGLESDDARRQRRLWEKKWELILRNEGLQSFGRQWQAQDIFSSQRRVSNERLKLQDEERRNHQAGALADAMRILGLGSMPNFWPQLAELQIPVRWIVGERDEKFTAFSHRARDLSERITVCTVPNAGHNPLLEAPNVIRDFMQAGKEEK